VVRELVSDHAELVSAEPQPDMERSEDAQAYLAFVTCKGIALPDAVGGLMDTRCNDGYHFRLAEQGDIISVSMAPDQSLWWSPQYCMCRKRGSEPGGDTDRACNDGEPAADEEQLCQMGCADGTGNVTTYYFRRSDAKSLGRIVHLPELETIDVEVTGKGFAVKGRSCHEIIPIPDEEP